MYRLANGVLRRLCAFTVQNARRKQQLLDDWRVLQVPRPRGARAPPQTAAAVWPGACLEAPCQRLTMSTAAPCVQVVQRAEVSGKAAAVVAGLMLWQAMPAAATCACPPHVHSYQVLGTTGGRRLQGRIDIMADLANWAPPQAIAAAAALQPPAATGQSRGAQEGSPRDAQAGASAPSAPMWPGGGGDAAGCGGGDPEGGPAPGRGHAAAAAAAVDGERGAVQRRMVPGRQL